MTALLAVTVGCGSEPARQASAGGPGSAADIGNVSTGDGPRQLQLHVSGTPAGLDEGDPCFERFEAHVEETASEIVVEVVRVVEADYRKGGCENVGRVVAIDLESVAGTRPVIDRHGGRVFTPGPGGYTTPEVCGLEDLACQGSVPPTTAVPAACSPESYRYAVETEIDGGRYDISDARCDGTWAAFDVDFGSDACLPEASGDDPCRGNRVHRTFWKNEGGRWRILAYQGSGDCDEAQGADRAFPNEICASP